MEKRAQKIKFLQLQACLVLLVCTLLPDFGSIFKQAIGNAFGAPSILTSDFDFIVFACQVAAIAGAALSLKAFYNGMKQVPTPSLVMNAGGILLAILNIIPSMPDWMQYVALVFLLGALFTNRKNLNIKWNSVAGAASMTILVSMILSGYNSIDNTAMTKLAALIGFIMYLVGLSKLGSAVDAEGKSGVSKLKISVYISILGVFISWIPLVGGIIGGIIFIFAFILQYMGYGNLMKCSTIGATGNNGASKVRLSMIVSVVAAVVNFFPFTGMIVSILSLLALWFVYTGWTMIYTGAECDGNVTESKMAFTV